MQGFDLIFGTFCWNQGKGKFGSKDEAKFLQSFGWGKVGSSFDAFRLNEWIEKTSEELKRARGYRNPLQTDENM